MKEEIEEIIKSGIRNPAANAGIFTRGTWKKGWAGAGPRGPKAEKGVSLFGRSEQSEKFYESSSSI